MAIPEFILQSFLDQVLGFLAEQGKGIVRDVATKKRIKDAIINASDRFDNEYPNQELAKALSRNTRFHDLESVRESIRYLLEHPFSPTPKIQIESQFKSVLPASNYDEVDIAASFFIARLQEELMGVEKLQATLSLIYGKQTADATERTAMGVEKLLAKQEISKVEFEKAREKYLRYIIDTNTYIDPRGIMQTRRTIALRLDEVYVSLSAEKERNEVDLDKLIERLRELEADDRYWIEKQRLERQIRLEEMRKSRKIDLASSIRENSRMVILGDPGAGKTTLIRFLALHHAQTAISSGVMQRSQLVVDKDGNNYGEFKFPVVLRVANYANMISLKPNLSIREYVFDQCGEIDEPKLLLKELLSIALNEGDALVLFDGLDEIVDIGARAEIGRRIEHFIAACHPKNHFVITSRIAGYRNAPLAGNFAHFTLKDMDFYQIEKFLHRWCPAAERSQTPDAVESEIDQRAKIEIDGILKAVVENSGVRRLASNPLMLTVLALIHRAGTRLPSRRVELYELAVKTLLEDWELARGIPEKNIVKETEALRLLGPLGYWMHENKPNGLVTESEAKEKLSEALGVARNLNPANSEIQDAVEDFLKRIREHTGIFVERAPRQYGFMHLTFEEYFAARELVRRRNDAPINIYRFRHNARWEEPILLAISFVSNDYPEEATDLILTALLAQGENAQKAGIFASVYEDVLHRDLLFASRAASDCSGLAAGFLQDVIAKLLDVFFSSSSYEKYRLLQQKILSAFRYMRGSDMAENAIRILLNIEKDKKNRVLAIRLIGQLGINTNEVIENLMTNYSTKSKHVRHGRQQVSDGIPIQEIAEALGQLGSMTPQLFNAFLLLYKASEGSRVSIIRILGKFGNATSDIADFLSNQLKSELAQNLKASNLAIASSIALLQLNVKEENAIMMILKNLRDIISGPEIEVLNYLEKDTPGLKSRLIELIKSDDWSWKKHEGPSIAFGKLGLIVPEVTEFLLDKAKNKNSYIREQAIQVLGYLRDTNPLVVETLTSAIKDKNIYVRAAAVSAIAQLGLISPEIEKALLLVITEESEHVANRAMTALVQIGIKSETIVQNLQAMFQYPEFIRQRVSMVLGRLGISEPAAVKELLLTLKSSRWDLRERAVVSLGQLNNLPSSIIEELLEMYAFDEQKSVQFRVAELLGRIIGRRLTNFTENQKIKIQSVLYESLKKSQSRNENLYISPVITDDNLIWNALWESASEVS